MIAVDANLLLYARFSVFSQHVRANAWLDGVLCGHHRVALPWSSLLAFVRLASNPRVLARPATVESAWEGVRQWLAAPPVWIPLHRETHAAHLEALIRGHSLNSKLVMDADLAALAIDHGLTLCTTDGDFARFRGLRWQNPLQAAVH